MQITFITLVVVNRLFSKKKRTGITKIVFMITVQKCSGRLQFFVVFMNELLYIMTYYSYMSTVIQDKL